MATHRIPIALHIPDANGNVYPEPSAVTFGANDRYPLLVWAFKDTSTRDTLTFWFGVPKTYVGTAKLVLYWATTATTGNCRWECDYTSVDAAETADPSSDQESVGATAACGGTARTLVETVIDLTGANFAADDLVMGRIARDGAEAGPADTIAATVYLFASYFQYADA